MDFDAERVSFGDLLSVFWQGHNPALRGLPTQYKSIIFCHDEEQQRLALATKQELEPAYGKPIQTEIRPAGPFYLAEGYHQKYYLRRVNAVMADLEQRYPTVQQLIDSNVTARLNGYVGGYGTASGLEQDIPVFDLSPASQERMRQIVDGYGR